MKKKGHRFGLRIGVKNFNVTWDVHTGRPSWHQQRAGHISSGVTSGFATREEAEEYVRGFKKHHPNEPAWIEYGSGRKSVVS